MSESKGGKAEGLIDKLGGKIQKETGKAAGDKDQIEKGEKDLAKGEQKSNTDSDRKA
ncbi:hypothetical protein GCM10010082_24260 [Kushneria pakistanensis]|uniref:CsbD family protein n=1 Tax=Kushneria pakistanensis TaxID=1508770 RepID=A0ABQ3FM86_9GAMM|nr:CsbD family protein [Kushneria pakistanensis]GHC29595.1 hypothetical protein GCM10010082_24260 [Kushneria pakistanensis]